MPKTLENDTHAEQVMRCINDAMDAARYAGPQGVAVLPALVALTHAVLGLRETVAVEAARIRSVLRDLERAYVDHQPLR